MNETPSKMNDVWIVIAAYNEAGRIDKTLRALAGYDTIVVDDGSGDETFEVARSHASWVLRHPINVG